MLFEQVRDGSKYGRNQHRPEQQDHDISELPKEQGRRRKRDGDQCAPDEAALLLWLITVYHGSISACASEAFLRDAMAAFLRLAMEKGR